MTVTSGGVLFRTDPLFRVIVAQDGAGEGQIGRVGAAALS